MPRDLQVRCRCMRASCSGAVQTTLCTFHLSLFKVAPAMDFNICPVCGAMWTLARCWRLSASTTFYFMLLQRHIWFHVGLHLTPGGCGRGAGGSYLLHQNMLQLCFNPGSSRILQRFTMSVICRARCTQARCWRPNALTTPQFRLHCSESPGFMCNHSCCARWMRAICWT